MIVKNPRSVFFWNGFQSATFIFRPPPARSLCRPHMAKVPVLSWIVAMLFLVLRTALPVKCFFTDGAYLSSSLTKLAKTGGARRMSVIPFHKQPPFASPLSHSIEKKPRSVFRSNGFQFEILIAELPEISFCNDDPASGRESDSNVRRLLSRVRVPGRSNCNCTYRRAHRHRA